MEGSVFSETDHQHLWIEYELFGDSLPGDDPPSDIDDYVDNYAGIERQFVEIDSQGNFEVNVPYAASGYQLSLAIRAVDTRDLTIAANDDPNSIDSLAFEEDAIKGVWDLYSFETTIIDYATDISDFELLEDTGNTIGVTSNPSVTGQATPYELVEIVTLLEDDNAAGTYNQVAVERITADSMGRFEFASPYFNGGSTNKNYQVFSRTVYFDLATQTEQLGTNTSALTFQYIAKHHSLFDRLGQLP